MKKILHRINSQKVLMLFSLLTIACWQTVQILGMHPRRYLNLLPKNATIIMPFGAYSEGIFKINMPLTLSPEKAIQTDRAASPTTVTTDEFDDLHTELNNLHEELDERSFGLNAKAANNQISINKLRVETVSDDATGMTSNTTFDETNNIIFEVIHDNQQRKISEVIHLHDENIIALRFYVDGLLDTEILGQYGPDKNLMEQLKYDAHRNLIAEVLYNSDHSYIIKFYNGLKFASEQKNYDAHDILTNKITYDQLGDKISEDIYQNDGSYVHKVYAGKNNPYLETQYNHDNQIVSKASFLGDGTKVNETIYNSDGSLTQLSYGKKTQTKKYNIEQSRVLDQLETSSVPVESRKMILKLIEKNPQFNEDADLSNMINSIINVGDKLRPAQIASVNKEIGDPYSSLTSKQKNNFIKILMIYQPLSDTQMNLAKVAVRKTSDNKILVSIMDGITSGKVMDEKGIDAIIAQ